MLLKTYSITNNNDKLFLCGNGKFKYYNHHDIFRKMEVKSA